MLYETPPSDHARVVLGARDRRGDIGIVIYVEKNVSYSPTPTMVCCGGVVGWAWAYNLGEP